MMNMTQKMNDALQMAYLNCNQNGYSQIEPEHLLQALLEQSETIFLKLLASLHIASEDVQKMIAARLKAFPKVDGQAANANLSRRCYTLLQSAEQIAQKFSDKFLAAEHWIMALVASDDPLAKPLIGLGLTAEAIGQKLQILRGNQSIQTQDPDSQMDVLAKYTQDLTSLAAQQKLDPIIGRDEEIRRVMQILSRRTKNNPILIGQPGVGKTAIAEGLALKIAKEDVPESLLGKRVLVLDLGSLLAGTKFRGEFEERLKGIIKEISDSQGQIILFIDEIHTIIGAGASEGAMDASNLLKPALARGELRTIGATTLDEYKKHIEKDPAFERRFQPLYTKEPSIEDTITILRGIKEKYELHHGVPIKDEALIAAATLSVRYITNRFLPDKAIDLVDEAASRIKMEMESQPVELDQIDRTILELNIEKQSLVKEEDQASSKRLEEIEKSLTQLLEKQQSMQEQWEQQKKEIAQMRSAKQQLEQLKKQQLIYEKQGNLSGAAEIKHGLLPALEKQIQQLNQSQQNSEHMVKMQVSEQDIAKVVSNWTGIPVSKMLASEKEKYLNLEAYLEQRVVGQDKAVSVVADAIRRNRAGLSDENKPMGSFLFLGPTGVGKTELAKALAEFLFNDPKALIRLDMSEYMEKISASRLVGSPPGYVGYEQGGQLTEAIRRRPYSVVLLDEIEKAHPDIFNILLQVLDDGRLTDNQGHVVNFSNTIFILTSNLGSQAILTQNFQKETEKTIDQILKKFFKPEFLNRLDEMITFNKLGVEQIQAIVDIQIKKLEQQMNTKGLALEITPAAKKWIATQGYDAHYGARPLKRVIQTYIQNPLAKKLIQGEFESTDLIKVDVHEKTLSLSKK